MLVSAPLADCKRDLLWTDKYAPTCLSEMLGKAANIKKLCGWLEKWKKVTSDYVTATARHSRLGSNVVNDASGMQLAVCVVY